MLVGWFGGQIIIPNAFFFLPFGEEGRKPRKRERERRQLAGFTGRGTLQKCLVGWLLYRERERDLRSFLRWPGESRCDTAGKIENKRAAEEAVIGRPEKTIMVPHAKREGGGP